MKYIAAAIVAIAGVSVYFYANELNLDFKKPELESFQNRYFEDLVVAEADVHPQIKAARAKMIECHETSNVYNSITRYLSIVDVLLTSFVAVAIAVYKPENSQTRRRENQDSTSKKKLSFMRVVSIVAIVATLIAPISLKMVEAAKSHRSEAIIITDMLNKTYSALHKAKEKQVAFEIISELESATADCGC